MHISVNKFLREGLRNIFFILLWTAVISLCLRHKFLSKQADGFRLSGWPATRDIGYLCRKNKKAEPLINSYHTTASFFRTTFRREDFRYRERPRESGQSQMRFQMLSIISLNNAEINILNYIIDCVKILSTNSRKELGKNDAIYLTDAIYDAIWKFDAYRDRESKITSIIIL